MKKCVVGEVRLDQKLDFCIRSDLNFLRNLIQFKFDNFMSKIRK